MVLKFNAHLVKCRLKYGLCNPPIVFGHLPRLSLIHRLHLYWREQRDWREPRMLCWSVHECRKHLYVWSPVNSKMTNLQVIVTQFNADITKYSVSEKDMPVNINFHNSWPNLNIFHCWLGRILAIKHLPYISCHTLKCCYATLWNKKSKISEILTHLTNNTSPLSMFPKLAMKY